MVKFLRRREMIQIIAGVGMAIITVIVTIIFVKLGLQREHLKNQGVFLAPVLIYWSITTFIEIVLSGVSYIFLFRLSF